MTIEKKLELLAEILDVEVEELKPEAELADVNWDSVAALSFIALMDEEFEKEVKGTDIKKLETVQDVLDMMEA